MANKKDKKVKHFTLTVEGYEMLTKICDAVLRSQGLSAMQPVTELLQGHVKAVFEKEEKEED